MGSNRHMWLAVVAALGIISVGVSSVAAQTTSNWEYSETLGGWRDKKTGLVWSKLASASLGGSWSWNGANNVFVPRYRALTGNSKWRLPTVAEMKTAYANGAPAAGVGLNVPPAPGQVYNFWMWSSEVKGSRYAYAVTWKNGASDYWAKTSYGDAILVYKP